MPQKLFARPPRQLGGFFIFAVHVIALQWNGAAADNPFERQVDIDVDFADGWDVALDYLREQFGVAMERVSEPITYEVLVMRPHGKGAK